MAGALKETAEEMVRRVYSKLQAADCPLLEGLNLQEAESMLDLLCVPSPYRTEVLIWMYKSINPNFNSSEAMTRSKDPNALFKEMAAFGQDLMLCRADELGLFTEGGVSVPRQLQFMEELVSFIHFSEDEELNISPLDDLFSNENLPISKLLRPTVDPWPTHMKILKKNTAPSCTPITGDVADVTTLLQETQSALEQLKSKCEFLNSEEQSSAHFSPDSLQIAARDFQQLTETFSRVYEPSQFERDPPVLSKDPEVFQRTHRQLLALNTERILQNKISETRASVNETLNNIRSIPWFQNKQDSPENEKKELIEHVTNLSLLYLFNSSNRH